MNQALETLAEQIAGRFAGKVTRVESRCGELTFEVDAAAIVTVCTALRDEPEWRFEQLSDLCGVDYLHYGRTEWNTDTATFRGFSRGVDRHSAQAIAWETGEALIDLTHGADVGEGSEFTETIDASSRVPAQVVQAAEDDESHAGHPPHSDRFAVVYHLLSIKTNRRLRLRAWCHGGEPPMIDSVIGVWKGADWFEREAFDLYGMLFRGHPDLRRLLTDYGFLGHPFRKDFPLSGNVEVRYDPTKGRVVYEPVTIEPRTLVPRVIREDNRYAPALKEAQAKDPGNV
jgi:NADH-quinone oxidoreductase subunit C